MPINYLCDTFDDFVKNNWQELVEEAEALTGEQYDGQEPLLTKESIIEVAREAWEEEQSKHS